MKQTKREFLQSALAAGVGFSQLSKSVCAAGSEQSVPSHLRGYEDIYARSPRDAALAWFKDAKFGLFMHYGLYSEYGRGAWVQLQERIPVAKYANLTDSFDPKDFDADFITDLALDAGMKYVNITSKHHDGFCLFHSKHSQFNSADTAAGRDLVGELAEQCQAKGLGLFLYYSYAADWQTPYFYPNEYVYIARPDYATPQPEYKWQSDSDSQHYIDFVHQQMKELLTNYGDIAGIWLDPIIGYYARPDLFPIDETYELIGSLQPHALISFKQGATGTEDFAAPERHGNSLESIVRRNHGDANAAIAAKAWASNKSKWNEICDTLQPSGWACKFDDDGNHKKPGVVYDLLGKAFGEDCNLLMNTGPLPDGSIHHEDIYAFQAVGRMIRSDGYPEPIDR